MSGFRFAIMGAGKIGVRFCRAVREIGECEVVAVSSKSRERAETFAAANAVPRAYDSYERMLVETRPDCVYIATTPDSHFELTMLCLAHDTPVLCEKAMFVNSEQARTAFALSEKKNVFVMEALWSRFLPANVTAKGWLDSGRIGKPAYMDVAIGFAAPSDPLNRYFNPKLGGGASRDITVYAYEMARYFIDKPILNKDVKVIRAETGVDMTERVTLDYGDMLATLATSFAAPLEERSVIYGDKGRIVVPHPHYASEALLYEGASQTPVEHFAADGPDGFTYEIRETMNCVRAGKCESATVPHQLTIDCAELFDAIDAANR